MASDQPRNSDGDDPGPGRAAARLIVVEGDITRQAVDAIVNAANSALKRGGGVDGAIHRAAGPRLQDELDRIGGCPTGACRLSGAHDLPVRHLIHCVGPVWHGGGAGEDDLLAGCYAEALALARENTIKTIAFPAISTGIFGFPPRRAAEIAVGTVRRDLERNDRKDGGLEEVRFVCFDRETADIYRQILGRHVPA